MLVDGWPFWDAIFALPMIVQTAKRYKGGNHSWVTSIAGMRDALNFSPLQISYGIPQGYEVQSIVQDTGIYSAYHSTTCYWIDSQGRYYIQDSIGKEFKILEANFNLTGIKSFRDLPTDWKDKNFMDKGFTMSGDGKTLIGFFKIHSEEEAKAFGTITNIQVPLKPDGSGKINWEELNKGIVPRNDL